jgi:hypothetical protein
MKDGREDCLWLSRNRDIGDGMEGKRTGGGEGKGRKV